MTLVHLEIIILIMKPSKFTFFVAAITFVLSVAGTAVIFKFVSNDDSRFAGEIVSSESGQAVPKEVAATTDFGEIESLSPYSIEEFIKSNRKGNIENLWKKLNISGKFNGLPTGWQLTKPFFQECHSCEADISEYDLDGDELNEIVVSISDRTIESCRYLIFTRRPPSTEYTLVGHIDHDFGRYRMPSHVFMISGGRSFIVVQVQTQSGSGVSMYFDRLFAVQNNQLVEVLNYPARGKASGGAGIPQRKFSGRVTDVSSEKGEFKIEISLRVSYDGWIDVKGVETPVNWSKEQRAVFSKPDGTNQAIMKLADSNISEAELKAVYDVDTLGMDGFLKYNRKELKSLNIKPDQWLR